MAIGGARLDLKSEGPGMLPGPVASMSLFSPFPTRRPGIGPRAPGELAKKVLLRRGEIIRYRSHEWVDGFILKIVPGCRVRATGSASVLGANGVRGVTVGLENAGEGTDRRASGPGHGG